MPTGVFGQVVTTHEAAVTHIADKLLLTSVCPAVAGELIGSGKPFIAAVPVTAERLLTCRGREDGPLEDSTTSATTTQFVVQTAA